MKYVNRITDDQIKEALGYIGGILISGPKASGKTESAKQFTLSRVNLQTDKDVKIIMESDPNLLLVGETPRLIDEWQLYPTIWNYVRHTIDERDGYGQFILTGSSTPKLDEKIHSGAGRFIRIKMRPMSWLELGYSDGSVSLSSLLEFGVKLEPQIYDLPVKKIAEYIAVGGWPTNLDKSVTVALSLNKEYLRLLAETDISVVAGAYRDPVRVSKLLESYARNIATPAKLTTLANDTSGTDGQVFTAETASKYLDELSRLMVVEDLPVWLTHIRSSAKLRQTPKRHFVDPSLAVAALGLAPDNLLKELRFTGFLFESEVLRDIRVYAERNKMSVYYYRDTEGDEVDIVLEKSSGEFVLIEVKLGSGGVEEGVSQLNKVENKLPEEKRQLLRSKTVIVGSGLRHTRPDGIHVIPLGALGV